MNQKHVTLAACLLAFGLTVQAQDGGISPDMLKKIQSSYQNTAADKALRNAMGGTSIKELALNQENQKALNTDFSIKVESKGITDQQSSGRCWLFTGLNVMRAKAIARYDLPGLEFSQVYSFFWDQLEKSNLFLQGVIETAGKPMNDQTVEWLFKHPLSDGGTFTGVADIVSKYGLVPKEAMPETYSSEHTSYMSSLIGLKLKEFGLELREMAAKGDMYKVCSLLYVSGIASLGTRPYFDTMSATPVKVPPSLSGCLNNHSTVWSFIGLPAVSITPCKNRLDFSSWSQKKEYTCENSSPGKS
jgi:bleomycin hydrolase